MTIIQKYHIDEMFFGRQTFRFVVSDNYQDLFKTDDEIGNKIFTDVIQFKSIKKDLELENDSFAVDEMQFDINAASCLSIDDKRVLSFCLQTTDSTKPRYIALFFSDAPNLSDLMFVGRINPNISSDDLSWDGSFYSSTINPLRSYSFTALSFDINILSECKIEENVYNQTNELRPNIYQRLFNTTNYFNLYYNNPLRYMFDGFERTNYSPALINLYDYISKLLELSGELLEDIFSLNISLSIIESDIGLEALPATFDNTKIQSGNYPSSIIPLMSIDNWTPSKTKKVKLKIGPSANYSESPIYIHRKMVHDKLGDTGADIEIIDDIVTYKKQREKDRNLSFASKKSVAEILFSIAKSLGCFVVVNYTAFNSIQIQFVSRENIVANEEIYIIGADKASLDTGLTTDNEKSNYYSLSTTYLVEGKDFTTVATRDESEEFKSLNKNLEELKEAYKYENIRLALSISPTLERFTIPWGAFIGYHPLGMRSRNFVDGILESPDLSNYLLPPPARTDWKPYDTWEEELQTGIYIKTDPFDLSGTQPKWIHRPVAAVVKKISGKDEIYTKLSDYVNDIYRGSQSAYQSEYELTVPFWNGFNTSNNFEGSSWKNLKLGSKITFSEPFETWDGSNWISENVSRTFVVVGIGYSLDKPETKIRLVNISAFAFGFVDSIPDFQPQFLIPQDPPGGANTNIENFVTGYIVENNQTISAGDPVQVNNNGKLVKAFNNSNNNQTLGIALNSGTSNEEVKIKTEGLLKLRGIFNFSEIGKPVFLRGNSLSQIPLIDTDGSEDVYSIIGIAISSDTIKIAIEEYVYE